MVLDSQKYAPDISYTDVVQDLKQKTIESFNIDNYDSLESFYKDFQTWPLNDISPLQEEIVIWVKDESDVLSYKTLPDITQIRDLENYKEIVEEIFQAYKDDEVYAPQNSLHQNRFIDETVKDHPLFQIPLDIAWWRLDIQDEITKLSQEENLTQDQWELLSFLYDMNGEFENASKARDAICELKGSCDGLFPWVEISGYIYDDKGNPIPNISVKLQNFPQFSTLSQEDGSYKLWFILPKLSYALLKVSLNGTEIFKPFIMNRNDGQSQTFTYDFYLK